MLTSKTIAVTGATGGIGNELCEQLASRGASLLLLDRNTDKSTALRDRLKAKYHTSITCLQVDLEDFHSVKQLADTLQDYPIDVFIHNAGAYSIPRRVCETGFDNVFQINFVSPYYLIRRLLPQMRERGGKVVAVGSIAHNYSKLNEHDIDFSTRPQASKVYGNAKRFLMFSLYELFRNEHNVSLAVTHPGITFTNITAHYPPWLFAIIKHPMKVLFMKPKTAALSVLQGVYDTCDYHEWIGPRLFDVWGLPKKRLLRTVTVVESHRIGEIAEDLYNRLYT